MQRRERELELHVVRSVLGVRDVQRQRDGDADRELRLHGEQRQSDPERGVRLDRGERRAGAHGGLS